MGMIKNDDELRETCDVSTKLSSQQNADHKTQERDGWYTSHSMEQIKIVIRHKFFSLLEGHIPSDEECAALLSAAPSEGKTTVTPRMKRLKAGKHNMAKGAVRAEDAAVS